MKAGDLGSYGRHNRRTVRNPVQTYVASVAGRTWSVRGEAGTIGVPTRGGLVGLG